MTSRVLCSSTCTYIDLLKFHCILNDFIFVHISYCILLVSLLYVLYWRIYHIMFFDILSALHCLSVIKSYQNTELLENISLVEFRDIEFFPKYKKFYLSLWICNGYEKHCFLCCCFLWVFFCALFFGLSAQILYSNPPKIHLAILFITFGDFIL